MTTFEKITEVYPSYDKRDPNPKKNYGISSCKINFILKGNEGAVQFLIGTNWYIPSAREHINKFSRTDSGYQKKPDGWDLGYHSYKPMYEGHSLLAHACDILDGKPCYYDGSGLRAEEMIEDFIAGGTDWLWKRLEKEYNERFITTQGG